MQKAITNLGDLASALPVAAVLLLWAWTSGRRAVATVAAAGVIATVILTAGLKVFSRDLFAEPHLSHGLALSAGAPSGHAAIAAYVYGVAFLLFAGGRDGFWKVAGMALSLGAIVGVAVTRVTLETHTTGDVLAALLLAGLLLAPLAWLVRRSPAATGPTAAGGGALLAILAIAAIAEISGVRITSTEFL
jgi:membrane-associated phospholipid phosphatase